MTLVLVHHSTKYIPLGKPMGLEDLCLAGVGEALRGWLLLSRQTAYNPARPGEHDLIVNYGGSAGHCGVRRLHISEGRLAADFTGRQWQTRLTTPDEAAADAAEARQQARSDKKSKTLEDRAGRVVAALKNLQGKIPRPVKQADVKEETGLSGESLSAAVTHLIQTNAVRVTEKESSQGGRKYTTVFLELSQPRAIRPDHGDTGTS